MWWGSVSSDESNTFSAFPRGLDLIFLLLMCAFQGNVISFFFVISPEGRNKKSARPCVCGECFAADNTNIHLEDEQSLH